MADAYNVRVNGDRYYVYRLDGNVQVAEYMGPGAAAKAQNDASRRNADHNERFGKKKDDQELVPQTDGWVEGGDGPETVTDHPDHTPMDSRDNPTKGETPGEETEPQTRTSNSTKTYKVPKKAVPDPPPGQGTNY